jgi:signal peptidase II
VAEKADTGIRRYIAWISVSILIIAADQATKWAFFVVLATAVSGVMIAWLWRIRQEGPILLMAGLSFVLGGAIGNLIDRAMMGYVTDFIQVWFGSWAFPSFNVADSAITVGAVLLIIDALLERSSERDIRG